MCCKGVFGIWLAGKPVIFLYTSQSTLNFRNCGCVISDVKVGSFADGDGGLNGCGVLDTLFIAMVDLAWWSMGSMSPVTCNAKVDKELFIYIDYICVVYYIVNEYCGIGAWFVLWDSCC